VDPTAPSFREGQGGLEIERLRGIGLNGSGRDDLAGRGSRVLASGDLFEGEMSLAPSRASAQRVDIVLVVVEV